MISVFFMNQRDGDREIAVEMGVGDKLLRGGSLISPPPAIHICIHAHLYTFPPD